MPHAFSLTGNLDKQAFTTSREEPGKATLLDSGGGTGRHKEGRLSWPWLESADYRLAFLVPWLNFF